MLDEENNTLPVSQSGVSEVIYFVEKRSSNPDTAYIASHRLLSMAGVKVIPCISKYSPKFLMFLPFL